jgi:glycine/D-amino acid oxidase-like deaminating enzyme
MPDVIVIGGGVVGASVCLGIAKAGAHVALIEAKRVGGGTSGASFAWVNSRHKRPRTYHDLNVAGMKAHRVVGEEFGAAPWWHGGGAVEWVPLEKAEDQAANLERLNAWGYAADWITAKELRDMEPDLDPVGVGGSAIAYYPEEGWVDPVVYAHAMLSAARRHGAHVSSGARVTEIVLRGDRVGGLRTGDGLLLEADVIVNCAGRLVNDVAQEAGLRLPLAGTVGFLVFTPPVASGLSRVLHTPAVNVRPDGAGRLMLHSDEMDETVSVDMPLSPAMAQARELVARARRVLPSIGEVEAEAVRVAVRPIPADGFSAVGPVPQVRGYYVVVTHSGVTLSPFLGRAVAEEVVGGRTCGALREFRPARFFH